MRDLTNDPVEREALFRRILASLDPESLRQLLSGEQTLDAVGAAVDAGRFAVDEADRYMTELAVQTKEQRGLATMEQLIEFLRIADPDFRAGSETYAVLSESEGGELSRKDCITDLYAFDDEDTGIAFDRTAASFLNLRRDQTGGIGNARVDPLLRAAIEITDDPKSRESTWVTPTSGSDLCGGDIHRCGRSRSAYSELAPTAAGVALSIWWVGRARRCRRRGIPVEIRVVGRQKSGGPASPAGGAFDRS